MHCIYMQPLTPQPVDGDHLYLVCEELLLAVRPPAGDTRGSHDTGGISLK